MLTIFLMHLPIRDMAYNNTKITVSVLINFVVSNSNECSIKLIKRFHTEIRFGNLKVTVDITRTNEDENNEITVPGIITCYRTLYSKSRERPYIVLI
jgi:hypothetical protein